MDSFDKLKKKFQEEVLKQLLPNGKLNGMTGLYSAESKTIPLKVEILSRNELLKGSKYYYNQNQSFAHYTSIHSLISMIQEKGIRMYNLLNSNDPQEYNFASNTLRLSNVHKEKTFIFSMTETLDNEEDPVMWRLYGNNGQGCVIIFEQTNNSNKFFNFHLSKVYYNDKDDIDTFFSNAEKFEDTNPVQLKIDLSRLIGFHKEDIWKLENEVRLLAYFENQLKTKSPRENINVDLNRRNERVEYNSLSLNQKDFNDLIPCFVIKKIILGYNVGNVDIVKKTIKELLIKNLEYHSEIKMSIYKNKIK